ncbi:MAG: Hpt domain-containing protein [Gammaproteobacteria bacterium]|nr:Hpt domain-containing protein [Gammaproteobacteria bacterium]
MQNDDKQQKLKAKMLALREKYCLALPEKYQDIEKSWIDYQADLSNPEFIETFYRLIHTLKGTASTFGFVTQGDICFEVQKLIIDAKENNAIISPDEIRQIQHHLDDLKKNIDTPAEDFSD